MASSCRRTISPALTCAGFAAHVFIAGGITPPPVVEVVEVVVVEVDGTVVVDTVVVDVEDVEVEVDVVVGASPSVTTYWLSGSDVPCIVRVEPDRT